MMRSMDESEPRRLELRWPGQGTTLEQSESGAWTRRESRTVALRGLLGLDSWQWGGPMPTCLTVSGQRLEALAAIQKMFSKRIRLAYFDLPRIEIDDARAAFRGDSDRRYSDWLTVVTSHLSAAARLLSDDGVVALLVGDREEPFARIAMHQVLGPENYIGTVVWQRHYSARQVPNSKELSAAHDLILLGARDRDSLAPVAIAVAPKGLKNPDNDPRGFWKGGHKGARKDDYPYGTHVPPYRWRVVQGALPPGVWRLNPQTGVMWAPKLEAAGKFDFTVECSDSAGHTTTKRLSIIVTEERDESAERIPVEWLWKPPPSGGELRITTTELPIGTVGKAYSAMLAASGGQPYLGEKWPGEGRYQEYPKHTLELAVLEDRAVFGRNGDSIPWIKKYADPEEVATENVYSIWLGRDDKSAFGDGGAGWTQDATKHLDNLRRAGRIKKSVTTAKPETLVARLINMFTRPGDWVLDVFSAAADAGAVSLKLGRSSIFLAGASTPDQELFRDCSHMRLMTVVQGLDVHGDDDDSSKDSARPLCVPSLITGGNIVNAQVSKPLAHLAPGETMPQMASFDADVFLTTQGYVPTGMGRGRSLDGGRVAVVIPEAEFLTEEVIRGALAEVNGKEHLTIYYFRAIDLNLAFSTETVTLVRVPFDLDLRGLSA